MDKPKPMPRACGYRDCGISTSIGDFLTFGRGALDHYGFWEVPCGPCARQHEKHYPEDGACWPFKAPRPSTLALSSEDAQRLYPDIDIESESEES